MDERIVVDLGRLVLVVALHGLQAHHLHEDHSQAKDISFWGYVRVIVQLFQFLVIETSVP